MKHHTPIWKVAATAGGAAMTATAVWLNAEHVASVEGWHSPLVMAGIIVTICAAVTPPFAERAMKSSQPAKAVLLWLFFALAVGFSLAASIARTSSYSEGRIASVEQTNANAKLAREAYEQAISARDAECASGRGPKCKGLENRTDALRSELATASPIQSTDPGADRLAQVLGITQDAVALYVPLFLPLGLELGGFIFLALGLAPAAQLRQTHHVVEKIKADALSAVPVKPKPGTRLYYLARLETSFPELAKQVHAGKLSVYRASIEAGMRRKPVRRQWDANDYVCEQAVD